MERYRPIAEYGLIGDCRTAALVGPDGSIDWFCWPRFDSPAVFARILDADAGGFWKVGPSAAETEGTLRYRRDTAILETEHRTRDGAIRVIDAVAPPELAAGHTRIVRVIEGLEGSVEVESLFDPRPAFGTAPIRSVYSDQTIEVSAEEFFARYGSSGTTISELRDGPPFRQVFTLRAGGRAALTLVCGEGPQAAEASERMIEECERWWREWCSRCRVEGAHREALLRSAITLKLLSHQPTGAIVAAPTASLPEDPGGERNWDYRYAWLRDASLTVHALLATGQRDAAEPFMRWVCDRVGELDDVEQLRIMYAVDGSQDIPETTLDHFEGYRRSRPVRIGNAAVDQLQLDVYGEVLECLSVCDDFGLDVTSEVWPDFRRVVDWVAHNWRHPDNGIWEVRGGRRHFVSSKVMAWVALDRGATIAERFGELDAATRWREQAGELHAQVLVRGWSDALGAFKQSYDDELLDAANLQIPLVGFLPPDDARVHSTIDATLRGLGVDGLIYRYRGTDDGLAGDEGTFTITSFWMVSALSVCGRKDEARALFERLLGFAGPLGLFAEEIDPHTRDQLGNYPQAFTHIGLISAAFDLEGKGAGNVRRAAAAEASHPLHQSSDTTEGK